MKVYAIFANDNIKGTTHEIFTHAINTLKEQGHLIDELMLYEKEHEIPFFKHDRNFMENHPFYEENKKRFLQADTLLLVFPLFWYSVPAILKAWIDMINGWAYTYQGGIHAKPTHSIKKVFIFYASMQSKDLLADIHNPIQNQLSETFKFIGIQEIRFHLIDNVNSIDNNTLKKHLEIINQILLFF